MLLTAKGNAEYERIPADTHIASCYTIADLGTQPGFEGKPQKKIVFIWETPNARMEDGRPFSVSKTYTASLYPGSNLRDALESWRGAAFTEAEEEGFDPISFLMKTCLLGVIHETKNGKTYSNIASISKLPTGFPAPSGCVNTPVYFSLEDYNQASFDLLPNWIKEKIKQSPEYRNVLEGRPVGKSDGAPTSMNGAPPRTPGDGYQSGATTEAPPAFPDDMPEPDLLTEDDIPF